MKLTFLGTGTSQGVPVIGCRCKVCLSEDRRNRRLRTSAMIELDDVRLVIDAGPDFREQMLREGVTHLDAILLTHEHKDHTGGIDDVRAFNFVDYPTIHTVHIYANERTARSIRKDFDYAFAENKYRGVPVIELHTFDEEQPFEIKGISITPIVGHHSTRFTAIGYRIGNFAYLTDFSSIDDRQVEKLKGVKTMVVNALRWEKHDSHFSVDDAIALIERIKPDEAYLTHMSHGIGLHNEAEARLPAGIKFAYDGLKLEINEK